MNAEADPSALPRRRAVVRREVPADRLPDSLAPVVRRVYAARGVTEPAAVDYRLARLHDATALGGIERAVELLARALADDRRILVVADYDADGATGCAVAVRGLRLLGARHVDWLVPNRLEHGYGLTPELVEIAAGRRPDLLITVDNGITSVEGVAAAAARGIEVLITDHHLPGPRLPAAAAAVNPNLPGDAFPSKHLAGVGVMFYVLGALRARLRADDWFARRGVPEPRLAVLLDLVALGTVADVVVLDANNRILVAQGLARIRAGACCAGIAALIAVAGRERTRLEASDLGYAIGPRLNAAGRLADMGLGVDCLLTDEPGAAAAAAARLDALNRERREVQRQMEIDAAGVLARRTAGGTALPPALALFDPAWHPGVVGVLAGRVKELTGRPVVAFASDGDGNLRGSARSVRGVNVRDLIAAVHAAHPDLVTRFGGHAMAAGLTLPAAHLARFGAALEAAAAAGLAGRADADVWRSDGALGPADFELAVADALAAAGPWGAGFEEPLFDGEFTVAATRLVGERHLHLQLQPAGARRAVPAIAFGQAAAEPATGARIRAVYRLAADEWSGRRRARLIVEQIDPPD